MDVVNATKERLKKLDALLTHAFNLPEHKIEFKHLKDAYGLCYVDDSRIVLSLLKCNDRGLLAWSTNVDTLCHELAHLVHHNHKYPHKRLTIALKEWTKHNGWY